MRVALIAVFTQQWYVAFSEEFFLGSLGRGSAFNRCIVAAERGECDPEHEREHRHSPRTE